MRAVPGPRGHRDTFSSKRRSAAYFERPAQQATEPRAKREARSVLCHCLMVDSTRENVTIHGEFEQLLLACSEGCDLHHNSIGSKFDAASSAHVHCTGWQLSTEHAIGIAHAY